MAALPQYVGVDTVAESFGVSKMTIYRAIEEGRFPAVRVSKRRYGVPESVLRAMHDKAVDTGSLVDAADYVAPPHAA